MDRENDDFGKKKRRNRRGRETRASERIEYIVMLDYILTVYFNPTVIIEPSYSHNKTSFSL